MSYSALGGHGVTSGGKNMNPEPWGDNSPAPKPATTHPLTSPLAYSPPYLGSKEDTPMDVLVVLDGLLNDPKVIKFQSKIVGQAPKGDGGDLTIMDILYKGLTENIYKATIDLSKPHKPPTPPKVSQVFCALSSTRNGLGEAPTYKFDLWRVDPNGAGTVEDYSVPLKNLLEVLYPEVDIFRLTWWNNLRGKSFRVVL